MFTSNILQGCDRNSTLGNKIINVTAPWSVCKFPKCIEKSWKTNNETVTSFPKQQEKTCYCSLQHTHTHTPATRITFPLCDGGKISADEDTSWRLQVSVTVLISTEAAGGGRGLMSICLVPGSWEGTGDLGLINCTHAEADKRDHLITVCATGMFDLKESLITGWLGCWGSSGEWFSPWDSAGIWKSVFWKRESSREFKVN